MRSKKKSKSNFVTKKIVYKDIKIPGNTAQEIQSFLSMLDQLRPIIDKMSIEELNILMDAYYEMSPEMILHIKSYKPAPVYKIKVESGTSVTI